MQQSDNVEIEAGETVTAIGSQIRNLRSEKRLTLKDLGERTGVSPSMLSLVERGKTSPSIGTLVAISSALGVHMSDLVADQSRGPEKLVSRKYDQDSFVAAPGVQRRVLRVDRVRGVEIAINEYEPDTGSGPRPTHHPGYEYGIVLKGRLTVELEGEGTQELRAGDLISYPSAAAHRIWNHSSGHVRALWINLD
ncbi:MAG: XRE family transcriptional regulator [Acidimicrobiia bacterium]|nr:XRE family transcriptional regulator [Acidimicrobiia bacterium]